MKKQISNWIVIPIILAAFVVLIGMSVKIGFDKGVEAEHQIAYNQGWVESYKLNYPKIWAEAYKIGYSDGQAPYLSSSNNTISLDKALSILKEGKENHLWWAAHSELQDKNTGDTAFNLMWANDNYGSLIDFVKWQANQ